MNKIDGENNCCIPPTLDGWVYIEHIHGPIGEPLYTWAQYTPTLIASSKFQPNGVYSTRYTTAGTRESNISIRRQCAQRKCRFQTECGMTRCPGLCVINLYATNHNSYTSRVQPKETLGF